jgi:bacillolysin
MAETFHRVRFNPADYSTTSPLEALSIDRGGSLTGFATDEAAARHYLGQVLSTVAPSPLRGLAPATTAQAVPSLTLQTTHGLPTDTVALKFEQTHANVPIFGTQVVVELRKDRSLVEIDGDLVAAPTVRLVPRLSQEQALMKIAEFANVAAIQLEEDLHESATLNLYHGDAPDKWHLAFLFRRVPATPPVGPAVKGAAAPLLVEGHGLAPRPGRPEYDYLVDAQDGEILYYFSSNPTLSTVALADVLGQLRVINIEALSPTFELHDSLRRLKTFDLAGQDYVAPLPTSPIQVPAPAPPEFSPAAVSAHANAAHVHDFYRSVLARKGVDDQGMYVISVINVTDSAREAPPTWHNAVWYQNKMWYGQDVDAAGNTRSYARFLDVIAHELTHGITQFTANLVYRDQSGALNESFSDIFGVLINNWNVVGGFKALDDFDWRIGPGLGKAGGPLRNLEDPTQTGMPNHMLKYLKTTADEGGVHTNSNIHNKAAHNVLTSKDLSDSWLFTPQDVAILYYLCLMRLPRTADFDRCRRTLLDVTNTYYAAQGSLIQAAKVQGVKFAYTTVGIG